MDESGSSFSHKVFKPKNGLLKYFQDRFYSEEIASVEGKDEVVFAGVCLQDKEVEELKKFIFGDVVKAVLQSVVPSWEAMTNTDKLLVSRIRRVARENWGIDL